LYDSEGKKYSRFKKVTHNEKYGTYKNTHWKFCFSLEQILIQLMVWIPTFGENELYFAINQTEFCSRYKMKSTWKAVFFVG
jgi:hypothetical protein